MKIRNFVISFMLLMIMLLMTIGGSLLTVEASSQLTSKDYKKVYNTLLKHKTSLKLKVKGRIGSFNDLENKLLSASYNNKKLGDFAYDEGVISIEAKEIYYPDDNKAEYTLKINYVYNDKKAASFDKKVKNVVQKLKLTNKSDYDKVKIINDYIVNNVEYDEAVATSKIKTLSNTAYGALIKKKAVCEGYALLFYRICKEVDLPVRFIKGIGYDPYNGTSGSHAWNIVKVDGKWYNIDVTWNDSAISHEYDNTYFLLSDADFNNHIRDSFYSSSSFRNKYKIATESLGYKD